MADPNINLKKMQSVRIKFSNGATGDFIGRACVSEDEIKKISVESIYVGPPEDITDQIREQVLKQPDT